MSTQQTLSQSVRQPPETVLCDKGCGHDATVVDQYDASADYDVPLPAVTERTVDCPVHGQYTQTIL